MPLPTPKVLQFGHFRMAEIECLLLLPLACSGLTGGGGLIRNCHGEWISGFARSIGLTTSLAAECWAVRDGLMLCLRLGLNAVEVEVDASYLVSLLANAAVTNSEISSLVDDCRDMLKKLSHTRVKHCYREGNKCADRLARLGTELEESFVIFEYPAPCYCISFNSGQAGPDPGAHL
nr:putative ribonuclease h protein [Quercus suber]